MKLFGLCGRSILRFSDVGIDVRFNSSGCTTVIGPSGAGKSTLFSLIHLVLAAWHNCLPMENGQELSSPFSNTVMNDVYCGERPDGKQSGSKSSVNTVAALFFTLPNTNNIFCIGIQSPKNSESVYLRAFNCEISASSSLLEVFGNTSCQKNVEKADLVSQASWILKNLVIVPQDHGLRGGRFASCFQFVCNVAGLFGDDRNGRVSITEDVRSAMRDICDVEMHSLDFGLQDKILQRTPGSTYSLSEASGGQWDCFFTLYGVYRSVNTGGCGVSRIVLLDEPGQNLGAHQRELLRGRIHQYSGQFSCSSPCYVQIIVVTHHIEMLHRTRLPLDVLRVSIHSVSAQDRRRKGAQLASITANVVTDYSKYSALVRAGKSLWANADNLSAFFAAGFIVVEGESEIQVLDCLNELLFDSNISLRLGIKNYGGLKWKVIDGKGNDVPARLELAKLLCVPYVYIYDFDKAFTRSSEQNSVLGRSGMEKSNSILISISEMSHLGGHASSALDDSDWGTGNNDLCVRPGKNYFLEGLTNWTLKLENPSVKIERVVEHYEDAKKVWNFLSNLIVSSSELNANLMVKQSSPRVISNTPLTAFGENLEHIKFLLSIHKAITGRQDDDSNSTVDSLTKCLRAAAEMVARTKFSASAHENNFRANLWKRVQSVQGFDVDKTSLWFARLFVVAAALKEGQPGWLFDRRTGPWAMPFLDAASANVVLADHSDFYWPPSISDIEGLFVTKKHCCLASCYPVRRMLWHKLIEPDAGEKGTDTVRPSSNAKKSPAVPLFSPSSVKVCVDKKSTARPMSSVPDQSPGRESEIINLPASAFGKANTQGGFGIDTSVSKANETIKEAEKEFQTAGKFVFFGGQRENVAMASTAVKRALNLASVERPILEYRMKERIFNNEGTRQGIRMLMNRLFILGAAAGGMVNDTAGDMVNDTAGDMVNDTDFLNKELNASFCTCTKDD